MGVDAVPLHVRLQHPLDIARRILTANPLASASLDGCTGQDGADFASARSTDLNPNLTRPLGVRLSRMLTALPASYNPSPAHAPLLSELKILYLLYGFHALADGENPGPTPTPNPNPFSTPNPNSGMLEVLDEDENEEVSYLNPNFNPNVNPIPTRGLGSGHGLGLEAGLANILFLLVRQATLLLCSPDAPISPPLALAIGAVTRGALPSLVLNIPTSTPTPTPNLHAVCMGLIEAAIGKFPILLAINPQTTPNPNLNPNPLGELNLMLLESAPAERLKGMIELGVGAGAGLGLNFWGKGEISVEGQGGLGSGPGLGEGVGLEAGVALPLLRFLLPLLFPDGDKVVAHCVRARGGADGGLWGGLGLGVGAGADAGSLLASCLQESCALNPAQTPNPSPSPNPNPTPSLLLLTVTAAAELEALRRLHARGLRAGPGSRVGQGLGAGLDEALVAGLVGKVRS